MSACIMAQEPADALRFSWTVPSGTARHQAIGGAMGSLGGDITATFVNPAGLAFYRTSDLTFSPAIKFKNTKSTYLGRTEQEKSSNTFNLGTTGFVFGGGATNGNIKNVSVGLAYNRSADFNTYTLYRGQNNTSSYSLKYLDEIRGDRSANSVDANYPFGASLAFRTYWIDTIAGGTEPNFSFQSRAQNIVNTGLLQQQVINTSGGINDYALGVGINVNDKVMLGATLGIPVLNYQKYTKFTEQDATANPNNNFEMATVEEEISTRGVGLNLKAGLIFKPQDSWRIGLAFHSPTLYNLTDRSLITVMSDVEGTNGALFASNEDITGSPQEFRYSLATPYRAIGSISYVLREVADVSKQKGFLTADVEYVNYKASSYTVDAENGYNDQNTRDYLKSLNTAIDNAYKGAFNFRVGGELKFTTLMVRGGLAYYGNPYQNINGEKGSKTNISGGLGYRNSGFFVDLTYVHALNKDVHFPYRLEDTSLYSGANVKSTVGNVLMTFGLKF